MTFFTTLLAEIPQLNKEEVGVFISEAFFLSRRRKLLEKVVFLLPFLYYWTGFLFVCLLQTILNGPMSRYMRSCLSDFRDLCEALWGLYYPCWKFQLCQQNYKILRWGETSESILNQSPVKRDPFLTFSGTWVVGNNYFGSEVSHSNDNTYFQFPTSLCGWVFKIHAGKQDLRKERG